MIEVYGFNDAVELIHKCGVKGDFFPEDTVLILEHENYNVKIIVILNHFEKTNLEATVYSTGNVSRKFIRFVYDYVFNKLEKKVLLMWTSENNQKMLDYHKRMGHIQSGFCLHKFGDGEDGVLFIQTKENLNTKYTLSKE